MVGAKNPVIERTHYDPEHDKPVNGLKRGICPVSTMDDMLDIVVESDRVLTFG